MMKVRKILDTTCGSLTKAGLTILSHVKRLGWFYMSSNENLSYVPGIDGLRAISVVSVMIYHLKANYLRGGFVGVDIFFVISGFLITQLLLKDIQAERFSILVFYERRIRRILPALLAVLLVTFLLGLRYCLPTEMVDLAKSQVAATLSASNVYFWEVSGYFDGPAAGKPLLHTWSLAVEEQFYIFWPLFLVAGHRFIARRLLATTLVITGLSLAASIIGVFRYPDATFYLPFTRIWELALGGLLPLGLVPKPLGSTSRNILAALGLMLIIGSVFMIDSDMPFPGLLALPPCLGALFILLAGRDGNSLVGRLLATWPLAFIGVISYSLYLWHWPVVVFQKNYTFLASGLTEGANKILIVAVSLVAATLSWRLIEQPFRTGPLRPSASRLVKMASIGSVLLISAGLAAWAAGGFPGRYSEKELRVAQYLNYESADTWRVGRCFLSGGKTQWQFAPECLALSSEKKNYLLLGDSHAAQLWHSASSTFPAVNFLQATAADCFPTVIHSVTEASRCTTVMDGVQKGFLLQHRVDRVILVARWKPSLLDNVAATLQWLKQHDIPVTLVGPSALFDSPLPRLMVSAMRERDPSLLQRHSNGSIPELDRQMAQLARSAGVPYISLLSLQCSSPACTIDSASEVPLIFDQEHFTEEGATLIAAKLRDQGLLP